VLKTGIRNRILAGLYTNGLSLEKIKMFIAMNRFKVIKEEHKTFEDLWVTRQSYLDEVKGFRAFHLPGSRTRGPYTLFISYHMGDTR
jgi:Antibiotic biosynthesis monooxygenase